MIRAFLSQFKWYRCLVSGNWYYVRRDIGERPCYSLKDRELLDSETLLNEENY